MQFVDENIHGECDDVLGVDLEPCWWRTFWCLICEAGYINTWVYQHLGSCFKSTKKLRLFRAMINDVGDMMQHTAV